jgi:hypothetical protein
MALEEILNDDRHQVAALLTTLTRESDCISMHGVRRALRNGRLSLSGWPSNRWSSRKARAIRSTKAPWNVLWRPIERGASHPWSSETFSSKT